MSIRKPQACEKSEDGESPDVVFPTGLVFDLVTDDFDEMTAIAPNWDHEHLKLGNGPSEGRLCALHTAHAQLATASWVPGIISRGSAPLRAITLALLLSKTGPASAQGAPLDTNQIILLKAGQEFEFSAVGSCKLLVVVVHEALITSYTAARWGEPLFMKDSRDRLLSRPTHNPEAVARRWESVLAEIGHHRSLLSDSVFARSVEEGVLERLLGRVVLQKTPSLGPGRHLAAKEAKEFIISHADDSLTIADLCRAVGANERTLLLAFNEVFGMPPKAYLKYFRLNRARQRLLRAGNDVTVTEVAIRCGFTHLSRFAADYRKMFGEYPRQTLKSATRT